MKIKTGILLTLLLAFCAFKLHDLHVFVVPQGWPEPVYDFNKNPLSNHKIILGKALFYDPILSRDNTISCSSCHSQYNAFTHVDHDLSHGIEDRIGRRNSPVLVNLAWQNSFMWDGAVNHLDVQALAPIHNRLEMDEDISNVVKKLNSSELYRGLFYNAFADSAVTGAKTLKAISQFMLTLVSDNSKYDKVMNRELEFSAQEANGYKIFQQNCSSCHKEPLFTNNEFRSNSLKIDTTLNDYGRVEVSGMEKDSFLFKVPTLRNIEFSFPYMHDGRYKTLSEVINHYTERDITASNTSQELNQKIQLTSKQKVNLIAFLLTLSDKDFLFNAEFSYPRNLLLNSKQTSNQ